jgi:putative transcriptional regulator
LVSLQEEGVAMKTSMTRKRSVGSRIIERLEGFKNALKSGQKISGRFTYRKVVLDLEPTPYGPEQVKQTRELLNASQALFAKFLGVSASTVRAWEHGTNLPSAMACRFLDEIRRDPQHWIERLKSAVVYK